MTEISIPAEADRSYAHHLGGANMFSTILVALDLSKYNESVFQAALQIAKTNGSRLMLVHVPSNDDPECPSLPTFFNGDYHPISLPTISTLQIYEELWKGYTEKSLEMLQHFVQQALQVGVTAEYSQNAGTAGKVICHLAGTIDADLVVLGRRGHSGWNELVAGSTSNYVLHHAPCSVLTVQPIKVQAPKEPDQETPQQLMMEASEYLTYSR
jgi:nucleotide-binding universal stress UspA family protein